MRTSGPRLRTLAGWLLALGLALSSCSADASGGRSTVPSSPTTSVSSVAAADRAMAAGSAMADAVSSEALMGRLGELERLTLSADGNRGPGSAGYLAAASYVEEQLRATGFYDVHRQPFTIQRPHPGESRLVDAAGRVINQIPLTFSPGTPAAGVSGRLVVPTSGNGCQADDWGAELAGQIALVERGACPFTVLNQAAAKMGAVALVVANNQPGGLYGTLENLRPEYIPATGITKSEGALMRQRLTSGEVQLTFTFDQRIESFETFNILAETRTGDPDAVVMAGAHLDSVPAGPGMNDNGSGSMILLETAVQLAANTEKLSSKVRFVWWGGEEWGLLGSLHWVNGLVDTDPAMIEQVAAYVNIDMVASPNFVIGVYDGDGTTFPDDGVPAGSAGLKTLFTSWFDRIGQPWVDVEFDGASDYASFMPSGVPVGGVFTGAGERKTDREAQLFGGVAGRSYDENYHQPTDTLANVSPQALEINGKATAFVLGSLAQDLTPVLPRGAGRRVPTRAEGFGYAGTI